MARRIDAEIISADSGQVYRGLDIGTAKPTREEQNQIRFHLIDVVNPDQKFSAAEFRTRALAAMADIQRRGRRILIVGGTGLYLRALEEGLFEGPSANVKLREELERRIVAEGVEALHRELQHIDPAAAEAISPKNRQRLMRALEVYRLTGRPISEFWKEHQRQKNKDTAISPFIKVGLDAPKEVLNPRIEARIEEMVEEGLLAEVRGLMERWGSEAPALKLIGYKEIAAYLQKKASLEAAIALVIQNTRQYAKRQRTWFKKDREIQWFNDANEMTQCLTK